MIHTMDESTSPRTGQSAMAGTFRLALLVFIFCVALGLRGWDIKSQWQDDNRGWAGAFYSHIARNYLTFGLSETKGAMVPNINPRTPDEFSYYLDHPPMVGWLVALSFEIFGYYEWSARIVALVCSMGSLVVMYFVVKRVCGPKISLCFFALMSVLPMGVIYGSFVDVQGPIVFFFCTLAGLAYLRFNEKPTWFNLSCLLGAFFLGALVDWPMYYLVPVFLVHHLLTARRRDRRILILLPALTLLVGAGFLLHLNYVSTGTPSFDVGMMYDAFLYRFGGPVGAGIGEPLRRFTVNDWFSKIVFAWWPELFTLPCLILTGLWMPVVLIKALVRKITAADYLFLVLLFFGSVHVLLFRQGAYEHDYWSYYLLPAVAFGSVMAISAISRLLLGKRTVVRTIFEAAVIFAVAAWSAVEIVNHEKESSREYSKMGVMIQKIVGRDELLLADFWNRHGMDFYLCNPLHYAPLVPANIQLARQRKDFRYLLLTNMLTKYKSKLYKSFVKPGEVQRIIPFSNVTLVDMDRFDFSEIEPNIAPPIIRESCWMGENYYLNWSHPQPERVAFYRIYVRDTNTPFYKDRLDVKGTEYESRIPGWRDLVVAVVAVGNDGEESYFTGEISVCPR